MTATTRTVPFSFDAEEMAAKFQSNGYFHAPGGATDELLNSVTTQISDLTGQGNDIAEWRFPEKKEQFLWEFTNGLDAEALCDAVADATGLNKETMRIAERHLKVYSATAPAMPPAHKDRAASIVTVGVGISIPEDSRLVMWPNEDRRANPFPSSAEWRDTRDADQLPEVVLADIPPTEIDLRRGDVVMFRGAEIYHERHLPASTAVLYLKFNDVGLDPLGEDPRTIDAEERSNALCSSGVPDSASLLVSPRVIGVRTDELFGTGDQEHYARMLGFDPGVPLSEVEVSVVRQLSAISATPVSKLSDEQRASVDRLARLGVVIAR